MNCHDSQELNNERDNLGSYFPFLQSILEAFKFIHIFKIIKLLKV